MSGSGWTIDDYKRWLMADLELRKGAVPSFAAVATNHTPQEALAFKVGYINGLQMAVQVVKLIDPRDGGTWNGEHGGERGSSGER